MKKKLLSMAFAAMMALSLWIVPSVSAAAVKYAEPATAAELAAMEQNNTGAAGMSHQLIDGEVFVWGSNYHGRLGLGLSPSDTVSVPTKIPRESFGGHNVTNVYSADDSSFFITDQGEIFASGYNGYKLIDPSDPTADLTTPRKIAGFGGAVKAIRMGGNGTYMFTHAVIQVKEADGSTSWYITGSCANGCALNGQTSGTLSAPYHLSNNIIAGKTIKDIATSASATYILTTDGELYGVGNNNCGQLADGTTINSTSLKRISFPNGVAIQSIRSSYRSCAALDTKGRVWTWGANDTGGVGNGKNATVHQLTPYLAFGEGAENTDTVAQKGVKLFSRWNAVMILCDDNTVWATGGYNFYGCIDPTINGNVNRPKQIFADISKKETIVSVMDYIDGIGLRTRGGNLYYRGSNASSGSGTTIPPEMGETVEQQPENLPPLKPTTANKVYMDIVYTDRTENKLNTVSGAAGAAGTAVTANVNAGQKFTVKVYFEDFAKLDHFTLPISFASEDGTPGNAKVVYKSGFSDDDYKAYSGDANELLDGSNVVSYGTNTGIQSNVRESVWPGGQLVKNNAYPRINNEKGYLSVYGQTSTHNASISGKQLMFSVDFIATETGNIVFDIMDAAETKDHGDPLLASAGHGGTWQVVRYFDDATGDLDLASYFDFNEDAAKYFPKVNAQVTPLQGINLSFYFKKDGKQYDVNDKVTKPDEDLPDQTREYYSIDKSNFDNTYVVQAGPVPENATDSAVENWDIQFDPFPGAKPEGKEVSDYIQIVETGTKSLTFKMSETGSTTTDGYFIITAKKGDLSIAPVYVQVASMVPPDSITITNAEDCPNPFRVTESIEALGLLSSFTYSATVQDNKANPTGNTNVIWTLYNCTQNSDGTVVETPIANNDLTAPAVIVDTSSGLKNEDDQTVEVTAQIKAQRTTPAGTYVKIKVVSTAGASVFDEATFRVELLSTGIVTDQKIYLGTQSSRRLNVSADPYDAYLPEYSYRVADDSPAALAGKRYITVSENGTVAAGSDYYEGSGDVYDEVIITENKSDYYYSGLTDGNKKTIKRVRVYVKNIIPPPDMDVEAQNNVGTMNDKVIFTKDLKEGDNLKIYKSYSDESTLAATYTNLTKPQIALLANGYVFDDGEGLSGNGGSIGYLVEREGQNFTEVPVNYQAEPCLLTGYVQLEGKLATSAQNKDIVVEISGLRDADGNPVPAKFVQDETGYFEFENYVPVGTYTLKLSRDLYMTRYITLTVTGERTTPDIVVSTLDNPVYLAPGDLGTPKNGREDPAEFNSYLYTWFGKMKTRNAEARFDDYNFVELSSSDNAINMWDIGLLLRYYNRSDIYKDWVVTQ